MKGKPLKGQGRTEDRVGGPQRGLRGGHQGLHTAATQDTGLSPWERGFLRADCRGGAGRGARREGQLLQALAAVATGEPWVPTCTLTVLLGVLKQASHGLRAGQARG